MKKILFVACLTAFSLAGISQNLQILSSRTIAKNGDDRESRVTIKNIGSAPMDIKVQRTVNNLASGHVSNFCWDICYGPTVSTSIGTQHLQPGAVDSINFIGDLSTGSIAGKSEVRYVFYDQNVPSDSVGITFVYNVVITGINTTKESKPALFAYPNPADNEVKIVCNQNGLKNAYIEVYNTLGSVVEKVAVDERNYVVIPTAGLNAGAYYYSLISEGKSLAIKKLVVFHEN